MQQEINNDLENNNNNKSKYPGTQDNNNKSKYPETQGNKTACVCVCGKILLKTSMKNIYLYVKDKYNFK